MTKLPQDCCQATLFSFLCSAAASAALLCSVLSGSSGCFSGSGLFTCSGGLGGGALLPFRSTLSIVILTSLLICRSQRDD